MVEGREHYIVVGVTRDQPSVVLEQAANVAYHFKAVLVCANVDPGSYVVAEHPDGSIDARPIDPDVPEWSAQPFDEPMAEHIRRIADEAHVEVVFRELAGEVAHALGRLAEVLQADMLVVGSRRRGMRRGLQDYLGGSVALHLVHRQPRPVLVVPVAPSTSKHIAPEGERG